jgi:hypothetical protein
MSEVHYWVVFAGEVSEQGDTSVATVKQAMMEKFKLPAAQVEQLFSGRRAVLKKGLDQAGAQRYAKAFAQIGAIVTVEPMPTDSAVPPSAPPDTPPPIGLALEPTEPPPPPAVSELSLSPQSLAELGAPPAPDLGGIAPGPAPAAAAADPYAPPATADLLVAPQDDGSQAHPPERVGIGRGWGWIADGFRLFGRAPGVWIGIVIIGFVIMMVLSIIPFINILAPSLLLPVIAGGLMVGTHRLARGGELEINDLFSCFKTHFGSLVLVGLVYLVGSLIIGGIVIGIMLGGSSYMGMLSGDEQALQDMMQNWELFALAMLVVAGLVMPLVAMTWFSPSLIAIHNVPLMRALGWSAVACFKNFLPFLLYGIVMMVLMFVAMVPVFLGLLVMGPVLVATAYTSYRDIFMK